MADVDVVAAYPITPQTHIPERLAEMVANGELEAAYIPVESEHSAMSACLGAAAVGARSSLVRAAQYLGRPLRCHVCQGYRVDPGILPE
jgi:pyruvate ferredoxin oxidoreductase alpha subunit